MTAHLRLFLGILLIASTGLLLLSGTKASSSPGNGDFAITSTYIEACSCDMFCPCYFNTHSMAHGHEHFCRANLVFKVDQGHYKDVKLDGAKVWHNLKYWNAQSNDGFRMWKSKREMYEGQGQKFDYSGTNGFLITIHYSGMAK